MLRLDVVLLPRDLAPQHLADRSVVVFAVLRATTSMAAALSAGVDAIHAFLDVPAARAAASKAPGVLLCGEERCLPPPGFDLGNSPCAFDAECHRGRTLFMSTTNGTRAICAAHGAAAVFTGALVNASAVAAALASARNDVTLLCAGTGGQVAAEDLIGAGAVLHALQDRGDLTLLSDTARIARQLFLAARADLRAAQAESQGGRNVLDAGLAPDLDFAAPLDALDAVGTVEYRDAEPPVVRRWAPTTARA
jgi:2-phosphosulfolactate phosphatase